MRIEIRHNDTSIDIEATQADLGDLGDPVGVMPSDMVHTNPLAALVLDALRPILMDLGLSEDKEKRAKAATEEMGHIKKEAK